MAQDIRTEDAFARDFLAGATERAVGDQPRAFYNTDGDCIEIYFSDASYRATRLDEHLTVLVDRESEDKIVGILLKGVHGLVQDLLKEYPGFHFEIQDGKIRVAYLLTAVMWKRKGGKPKIELEITQLRREMHNLEVDLALQGC